MPVCHRCERVQPTGELRRTKLGHVCLDGANRFSRCRKIEKELRRERRARGREVVSPTKGTRPSVA